MGSERYVWPSRVETTVRVLQIMAGARHGGAEAFFERLVIALGRRPEIDQRVVIRRDPDRAARLRAGGVEPVEMAFGGPLDLLTSWRLRREIAAFAPDIVLSWMSRATAKTPRSSAVHAARLGGYYDLKYFRRSDHLIANTPGIHEYLLEQGWPAGRAHYLPNFVDAEPGRAVDKSIHDTPRDARVVLALGRLHANKAYDVAIRALADLPGTYLWIAGEGPERGALTALAEACGVADRLRLLGWRTDVADLLAAADLLICPSRHEPLGNVVIEGWAHRVPVVAAESDGPRHLIEDGRTGLLVPVEDPAALAAAVREVLGDREGTSAMASALVEAGRAAYEDRFTEGRVVAAYLDLFARIRLPSGAPRS